MSTDTSSDKKESVFRATLRLAGPIGVACLLILHELWDISIARADASKLGLIALVVFSLFVYSLIIGILQIGEKRGATPFKAVAGVIAISVGIYQLLPSVEERVEAHLEQLNGLAQQLNSGDPGAWPAHVGPFTILTGERMEGGALLSTSLSGWGLVGLYRRDIGSTSGISYTTLKPVGNRWFLVIKE